MTIFFFFKKNVKLLQILLKKLHIDVVINIMVTFQEYNKYAFEWIMLKILQIYNIMLTKIYYHSPIRKK